MDNLSFSLRERPDRVLYEGGGRAGGTICSDRHTLIRAPRRIPWSPSHSRSWDRRGHAVRSATTAHRGALHLAGRAQLRPARSGLQPGHVLRLSADLRPMPPATPDARPIRPAHQRERSALVQRRDHLSAPRQELSRLERRWLRRLSRADREARLHPAARRQHDLAAAVLSVAAARTTATTSPRTRTINPTYGTIEDFQAFLDAAHARGHSRDHRAGDQPHLRPASVVPARAARAEGFAGARLVRVERRPEQVRRTRASSSPTPRSRTGRGTRWRSSSTGIASSATSPTSTSTTPRCSRRSSNVMRFWLAPGRRRPAARRHSVPHRARRNELRESAGDARRPAAASRRAGRGVRRTASSSPRRTSGRATCGRISATSTNATWRSTFRSCRACTWRSGKEDRTPIVDIMRADAGRFPQDCQWAIFLRNHDELTLEMVTDEERDYMYREYARDPRMRINVGIRRRLAPLMDSGRRQIELMNALLMSHARHADHLLRRRDRHGRQRLPRRPQRRAHADAVERRPQRRLLRRRHSRRSTAR